VCASLWVPCSSVSFYLSECREKNEGLGDCLHKTWNVGSKCFSLLLARSNMDCVRSQEEIIEGRYESTLPYSLTANRMVPSTAFSSKAISQTPIFLSARA
jgi:hypothetical protein